MKLRTFCTWILAPLASVALVTFGIAAPAAAGKGGGGGKNKVPDAITVPWDGKNLSAPHSIISGVETTLKASASDTDGTIVSYEWDFGDGGGTGQISIEPPAANVFTIEASHTYNAAPGTTFDAVLTVTDDKGATGTGTYRVAVLADTLEARTNIAVDKALWLMHNQLVRYDYQDDPAKPCGYIDNGEWNPEVLSEAFVIQSFAEQGHLISNSPKTDPYVDDAKRMLNYITTNLEVMTISTKGDGVAFPVLNPDSNGDGIMVASFAEEHEYEHGTVLKAFANAGIENDYPVLANETLNMTGDPANSLLNFTYGQITQNIVDFIAWAQLYQHPNDYSASTFGKDTTVALNPMSRGGWPYWVEGWNDPLTNHRGGWGSGAIVFWNVLGLEAAETQGYTVPQFVKDELALFVDPASNHQNLDPADPNYGEAYYGPNNPNINHPTSGDQYVANYHLVERAGEWLVTLNYLQIPVTDVRAQAALAFIENHWNDHNYATDQRWDGPYTTARLDNYVTWTLFIENGNYRWWDPGCNLGAGCWVYGEWDWHTFGEPGMNYSFFRPYEKDPLTGDIIWGWEEGTFVYNDPENPEIPEWVITKTGDDLNMLALYALGKAMKGYGIVDFPATDPAGMTWDERINYLLIRNQLSTGAFNEYNWVWDAGFGTAWGLMTMVEKAPVIVTTMSAVTPFSWSTSVSGGKSPTETLSVTVRIVDENGAGVEGAAVTADLDRDGNVLEAGMTQSTDINGETTFEYSVRKQMLPAGTYTLSLTNVVKTDITWMQTPPLTDSMAVTIP